MSMAYLQFSYGIATASSVQYYNSKVRCKYCYTIQYTCFILYNTFYIWYQTVDTMIVKELSPSPSRPYCETNKRWQWWESPFINESLWFQLSLTDKLLIVNIKQTIVTGTITTLWFYYLRKIISCLGREEPLPKMVPDGWEYFSWVSWDVSWLVSRCDPVWSKHCNIAVTQCPDIFGHPTLPFTAFTY